MIQLLVITFLPNLKRFLNFLQKDFVLNEVMSCSKIPSAEVLRIATYTISIQTLKKKKAIPIKPLHGCRYNVRDNFSIIIKGIKAWM